jgi:hypothetical protein
MVQKLERTAVTLKTPLTRGDRAVLAGELEPA